MLKLLQIWAQQTRLSEEAIIAQVLQSSAQQQTSVIAPLLEQQLVREEEFLQLISASLALPWWDTALPPLDEELRKIFPPRLALRHLGFPQRCGQGVKRFGC